jgi:hypothetical protein
MAQQSARHRGSRASRRYTRAIAAHASEPTLSDEVSEVQPASAVDSNHGFAQ